MEFRAAFQADLKPFADINTDTPFVSIGVFPPLLADYRESHHNIILHPFFAPNGYSYEIGTEHAVCALLLWGICENLHNTHSIPLEIHDFLESLDIGYLASESNISEEEALDIGRFICQSKPALLLGRDLILHKKHSLIIQLLGFVAGLIGATSKFYLQDFDVNLNAVQSVCKSAQTKCVAQEFEDLPQSDGAFIYQVFLSDVQNIQHLPEGAKLFMPNSFATIFKLQNASSTPLPYTLSLENGDTLEIKASMLNVLKGTTAILCSQEISSYPFSKITSLQGVPNV